MSVINMDEVMVKSDQQISNKGIVERWLAEEENDGYLYLVKYKLGWKQPYQYFICTQPTEMFSFISTLVRDFNNYGHSTVDAYRIIRKFVAGIPFEQLYEDGPAVGDEVMTMISSGQY